MIRSFPGRDTEAVWERRYVKKFRINDQGRICFKWVDGGAEDVEIIDYHR